MIENVRAKQAYQKRGQLKVDLLWLTKKGVSGFEEYFSFTFPSLLKVVGVSGFSLLSKSLE